MTDDSENPLYGRIKLGEVTFKEPAVAIISMIAFKDQLFVATTEGVYVFCDGKMCRIPFEEELISEQLRK